MKTTWPPQYTIRTSAKARNVSLKIRPESGLEVVIPYGFKTKKIPKLLEQKRSWIEKHLDAITEIELPEVLELKAINTNWQIEYIATNSTQLTLYEQPQKQLTIIGDIEHKASCKKLLGKWVQKHAKLHLPNWIEKISTATNLTYNNLTIRNQKTRWGSCSAQNNINLNSKLLLLPAELVDYVILHELCHTKHHNHSKNFWDLVERHQPNYYELRKQLREYKTL